MRDMTDINGWYMLITDVSTDVSAITKFDSSVFCQDLIHSELGSDACTGGAEPYICFDT